MLCRFSKQLKSLPPIHNPQLLLTLASFIVCSIQDSEEWEEGVAELFSASSETLSILQQRFHTTIRYRVSLLVDLCCAFIAQRNKGQQIPLEGEEGFLLPLELEEKLQHGGTECPMCGRIFFGEAPVSSIAWEGIEAEAGTGEQEEEEEREREDPQEAERRDYCSLACLLKRDPEVAVLLLSTA